MGRRTVASMSAVVLTFGLSLNVQPVLAQHGSHEGHHLAQPAAASTQLRPDSMIMADSMPMESMPHQS